jgi:hypothetical protein
VSCPSGSIWTTTLPVTEMLDALEKSVTSVDVGGSAVGAGVFNDLHAVLSQACDLPLGSSVVPVPVAHDSGGHFTVRS